MTGVANEQWFNISDLILNPRTIVRGGELNARTLVDWRMDSLIGEYLQKRSNFDWIDQLGDSLCSNGIDPKIMPSILSTLINRPAVKLHRVSGKVRHFRQAVLAQDLDGEADESYLVTMAGVAAIVENVPQFQDARVDVNIVNVTSEFDCVEICIQLERWAKESAVRAPSMGGQPRTPKKWTWLGDPSASGYREFPSDWQNQLRITGFTLGMRTSFALSYKQATATNAIASADIVVVLNGAKQFSQVRPTGEERGQPTICLGIPGEPFEKVTSQLRTELIRHVFSEKRADEFAPRVLASGEWMFHKKRGDSRGGYDNFDAGTNEACRHNKFTIYHGAPQAEKGMQRRYLNFLTDKVQLLHCKNCNLYAVYRPDRAP